MENQDDKTPFYKRVVLILFLITPLCYNQSFFDPTLHLRQLVLGIGLVFILFLIRKETLSFTKLQLVSMLLVLGTLCVSSLVALNLGEAIVASLKVLYFIVFGVVIKQLLRSIPDLFQKISLAFSISHMFILSIAIYQHINLSGKWNALYEIQSVLAHKNQFAIYLLLTLPFLSQTLFYARKEGKKAYVVLAGIGIVGSIFYMIFTQTRSVWLGAGIAGISTVIFILIKSSSKMLKIISVGIASLTLITLSFLVFKADKFSEVVDQTWNYQKHKTVLSNNVRTRLGLWQGTMDMIKTHPLGIGGGNWRINYPLFDKDTEGESKTVFFQRPHNDLLLYAAEYGVLFLGLMLFGISLVMVRLFRSKLEENERFVLFFSLIGFSVTALFSFPLERPYILMLLITLLMYLFNTDVADKGKVDKATNLVLIKNGWLLLLVIPFVLISTVRLRGEYYSQKAMLHKERNRPKKVIEFAQKSHNYFYSLDPFSTAHFYYSGMALFETGRQEEGLQDMRQALEYNPFHIHALNNMASMYLVQNKYSEAEALLLKVMEIDNEFNEAILNLATIYVKTERFEESGKVLFTIKDENVGPNFPILLRITFNNLERNKSKSVRVTKDNALVKRAYFRSNGNKALFEKEVFVLNRL